MLAIVGLLKYREGGRGGGKWVNSVVDIATCYVMDGQVFKYAWGRDLPD